MNETVAVREPQFQWDDLLEFMEAHLVVPVIGAELLELDIDGRKTTLQQYLGQRLLESFGLQAPSDGKTLGLHEAAILCLNHNSDRDLIYSRVNSILKRCSLSIPEPLLKLAEITDFQLFISTTFDSMLCQALNSVRFEGQERTQAFAYSSHSRIPDLPDGTDSLESLTAPVVYQLFGKASVLPDYVITEEDILEFIHLLQLRRPRNLFEVLKGRYLLLIGCNFSNWLSRFFIRTARDERLSKRDKTEIVADSLNREETSLVTFLEQHKAKVFMHGGSIDFVNELHSRWSANSRQQTPVQSARIPLEQSYPVFLSYSHTDLGPARLLKRALEDEGLYVWLDESNIESGVRWDEEIRRNVERCRLFVALVSHSACSRSEAYYYKEWGWAIERAAGKRPGVPFILPVAVDSSVKPDAEGLPREFRALQWAWFKDGRPPGDFVSRVAATIREFQAQDRGLV